jgi:acyl dehydratase
MLFEDFVVGQRFHSGLREINEQTLRVFAELSEDRCRPEGAARAQRGKRAAMPAAMGLAVFTGLFDELELVDAAAVAVLETRWRYLVPVHVGDTVRFEMTIIRCRRSSGGAAGSVRAHVALLNQAGRRAQEGTVTMEVRAREIRDPDEDPVGRAFGTTGWAEALARRLGDDQRFASAVASWDGGIGVRCGDDEVHLRIYRGRILNVSRRSPHGATFTVEADELTWTELLTGPRNDFIRRAMAGQFEVRGSGYEYLRLTKALAVLVDAAHALAMTGAAA